MLFGLINTPPWVWFVWSLCVAGAECGGWRDTMSFKESSMPRGLPPTRDWESNKTARLLGPFDKTACQLKQSYRYIQIGSLVRHLHKWRASAQGQQSYCLVKPQQLHLEQTFETITYNAITIIKFLSSEVQPRQPRTFKTTIVIISSSFSSSPFLLLHAQCDFIRNKHTH